jgi:hypothetical protein
MDRVRGGLLSEPAESAVDAVLASQVSLLENIDFDKHVILTIDVPLFNPRTVISRACP